MPVTLAPYSPIMTPASLPQGNVEALYVHVPFCFHKCHYCDFYSITRQSDERMAKFVDLTLREAALWSEYGAVRPRTIFFGGGTPSLLPLEQMRRLLEGLKQRFDLCDVEEWTIEVNPATAALDYCQMLREAGVNRLSFGAQSFNLDELKTLERHHHPNDVRRSVALAREAGFERLNLDLIYAIPGQTMQSWVDSLEQTIGLGTSHLSAYNLTFEPNTPMAVKLRLGQLDATPEPLELEMFRHTRRRLTEAGLDAYEISNYAARGQECLHNLVYWTGGNYIGLGPSAASHVEGTRFRNRRHLGEWESAVAGDQLPATDVEVLSPTQRAGELAMLRLRLSRGLNFDDFAARTGFDARALYASIIPRLIEHGLLVSDDHTLCLSERGLELADAVAAEFLDVST
ncbi:MAG TPA: radical SAM family heme chaperone HemW [Tepidisphaeraceae bacterium]